MQKDTNLYEYLELFTISFSIIMHFTNFHYSSFIYFYYISCLYKLYKIWSRSAALEHVHTSNRITGTLGLLQCSTKKAGWPRTVRLWPGVNLILMEAVYTQFYFNFSKFSHILWETYCSYDAIVLFCYS